MEQKNQKEFLVSERMWFESGQQILIFSNKILVIGSRYVTKQPKDLRCH